MISARKEDDVDGQDKKANQTNVASTNRNEKLPQANMRDEKSFCAQYINLVSNFIWFQNFMKTSCIFHFLIPFFWRIVLQRFFNLVETSQVKSSGIAFR